MNKTDELRTARIDSLVTPAELAQRHPVSAAVAEHVTASRRRIEKILNGEDKRLLVVIGPAPSTIWMPRWIMQNGFRAAG
jgi:3-deoxy-7-phosphoheptulonate synthase